VALVTFAIAAWVRFIAYVSANDPSATTRHHWIEIPNRAELVMPLFRRLAFPKGRWFLLFGGESIGVPTQLRKVRGSRKANW
jgi:hypothetical protein